MLWLSKGKRKMLTHPQCKSVIHGGPRFNIDWNDMPQGTTWTRCFESRKFNSIK